MKRIGTQRAWAAYGESCGTLFGATPGQGDNDIPVLVIPEADVSRCKHDNETAGAYCPDCGSYRRWSDSRWQRPRVLRDARAKR